MRNLNNFRCALCNKVSDPSIATNLGDDTKDHFHPDPKSSLHYVCDECNYEIDMLRTEYYIMDEEEFIFNYPF